MASKSKSKLIKELQDYNKQLAKHMQIVDVDKAIDMREAMENSNEADYYSMLTTNFVELRTEVALLRKNLSNDIESMVLKQVAEIQQRYFKQLNDFSSKIVFDIKENLGSYVKELNDNVSDIKKEFNKLSTKNELIENKFEELNENSLDFKAYIDKVGYAQNTAFKNLNSEIEKIHMQNSTSLSKVVDRLNSEIRSSREAFRRLGLEVNQSHSNIKKEIGSIKQLKEKPVLIDPKSISEINNFSRNEKISNINLETEPLEETESNFEIEDDNLFDNSQENFFKKENVKLLEIDKRIKNLQDLR